jgi:hypothetical protein
MRFSTDVVVRVGPLPKRGEYALSCLFLDAMEFAELSSKLDSVAGGRQ